MHHTYRSIWTTLLLAAVFFVAGCAALGSTPSVPDERLLGIWATDSGAHYTITADGSEYALGIVDYDEEVFVVTSLTWTDGTLAWTYDVPSTGYQVSEETISVSDNSLEVSWENQTGASGTDTLSRVNQ